MDKSGLVYLGQQHWVLASEVVGLSEGAIEVEQNRMIVACAPSVRSIVILRGGHLMPAYVSAKTVVERLRKAAGEGRHPAE